MRVSLTPVALVSLSQFCDGSPLADLDDAVTYGEHESLELRVCPDLVEDVVDVGAFGIETYVQAACDLFVAQAFSEALEHLPFAWGKAFGEGLGLALLLMVIARQVEQLDGLLRREQRLARNEASHRADDLLDVGGLVQKPAAPASTAREKSVRSKLAVKTSAWKSGLVSRSSSINSVPSPSGKERSNTPASTPSSRPFSTLRASATVLACATTSNFGSRSKTSARVWRSTV
jgi:hypothetical protein